MIEPVQCEYLTTKLRVLIVEDDLVFKIFYKNFLLQKGASVVACASLLEARQILKANSEPFSAIVLDNQLTDGEGIDLLPALNQLVEKPAVIMVSGNDDPEFFLSAFNAGIDDYMVKPVNMELLWIKLTNSIQKLCLNQLAASQRQKLEFWIQQETLQQQLAKHLFDNMYQACQQAHPGVHRWLQPSDIFSGDLLLQTFASDGSWYCMLADAMGHGLAPAISLMPVIKIFQSMAVKARSLQNIVYELNAELNRVLPEDRFVAAILLKVDAHRCQIDVWNGGMPALLCLNPQGQLVRRIKSANMALGVLDGRQLSTRLQSIGLSEAAFLVFYSDGLTESELCCGDKFDENKLIAALQRDSADPWQTVRQCFDSHPAADDISACLVDTRQLLQNSIPEPLLVSTGQNSMLAKFVLKGQALATVDLPAKAIELLKALDLPIAFIQRVFTVLTELFVNALEHGVLQLDSGIKEQADGFDYFYQEKQRRLAKLTDEHYIEVALSWNALEQTVEIDIADCGAGFSDKNNIHSVEPQGYGRGLELVKNMTDKFDILYPGNRFIVVLSL
jgi:response regulator of citrate/malate metabolism/anti-sigma regulatory factor (Ser/Thr protein kinase)